MRETDLADELFRAPDSAPPTGVRVATARRGGVTVTRVEIAREGLERPRGRYVTLEVPRVSLLDERDEAVIEPAAAELQALLPPAGPVLVLGVGNRRVTSDALGPRTVQKIFVTMGQHAVPVQGIRPVAAVAPGVSAATGLSLQQLAGALVREIRRAVPGPARPQPPSGCCPAGGAGRSGRHPDPDAGRGGQRPCSDPSRAGQRHRPRGRPAGRGH